LKNNSTSSQTTDSSKVSLSIQALIDMYLEESFTSKPASDKPRQEALQLFSRCLNEYAYLNLSKEEAEVYRNGRLDGKTFCQLFGPNKIAANIRHFAFTFLVCQKVGSPSVLERVAKVLEQFCKWLAAKNFVSADDIIQATWCAVKAGKDLPRAAKAEFLLAKECEQYKGREDRHNRKLGNSVISRIESHRIWLQPDSGKAVGPIAVSPKIIEHLDADWEIDCAVRQFGKELRIVEIGNIYPQ
jgi:hypothetical protein